MQCTDSHRIAPEGYPFIGPALVLVIVGAFIHWVFLSFFICLAAFVFYFFRNPKRLSPTDSNLILSPAFGKVIDICEVEEKRFLNRKARRISIFMSPLDVHINRAPITGIIKKVAYNKGRFLPAFAEKASLANEQNAVLMEDTLGRFVLFVQIAGFIARRIVCYATLGATYRAGDVYGLIRFGSRMDVYFSLDCTVEVALGQRVRGGETILARFTGNA